MTRINLLIFTVSCLLLSALFISISNLRERLDELEKKNDTLKRKIYCFQYAGKWVEKKDICIYK